MKFVNSCRFSSLILCLACLVSCAGTVWADEGDPIVDEEGDIVVEDHGKLFSISVKTADQEKTTEVAKESKPAEETMTGPVPLPQGVDVGLRGASYSVKRDEEGRIMRLDDASADGFLIEYRRDNETPGLDVWRKDGTYSWYDFLETTNKVSQGRTGFEPDTIMIFDRETGQQITYLADGTVVTASPDHTGKMTLSTKVPGQAAIQSKMDATGNLIQGPTRTVRDDQGRPTELYVAGRKISATRYNNQGKVVDITLDGGAKQSHHYDSDGQLIEIVDVYGAKTTYAYDLEKRQVTTTFPEGHTITKIHDAKGRLIEAVGPGNKKMELSYADNEITDCNLIGLDEQAYVPFDDGDVSIARSSLTGTWLFTKDNERIKRLDPLGQAVTFIYAQQGTLASIKDSNDKALLTLTYDDQANLTRALTPQTSVSLTYDKDGQLMSEKGVDDITITYAYTDTKMLKGLKDSKGHEVQYVTNENGQLVQLIDSKAGTFKMTYGAFGLPASLERSNGVKTEWQYDAGGRLIACTHHLKDQILKSEYQYNSGGQLTEIKRESGDNSMYTYDDAGYWLKVQEHSTSVDIVYDAWGQMRQDMNLKYQYNEAGHMKALEVLGADMTLAMSCDLVGRFVGFDIPNNRTRFGYDWDHRLVSCESPDTSETCAWVYDGLGRLAFSDIDEKVNDVRVQHKQHYVYANGELYGVIEEGRGLDRYIMLPGTNQCVAVIKADGTVLYPLWDHRHSILVLTDSQGAIASSRTFWSLGGVFEGEDMPIAIGYRSGLSFMQNTLVFMEGQAQLVVFHRPTAAEAPWPYQSSLRQISPFIAPSIERTH